LVGFMGASARTPIDWRLNIVVVAGGARRNNIAIVLWQHLIGRSSVRTVQAFATAGTDLHAWLGQFGFVQVDEVVTLERLLRPTMKPVVARLDEYVGTYVVASPERSMPAITIERHGEVLVSKVADMRDVLLASSESEFFTRYHDGRGRFERDSTGRVARLIF